MLETISLTGIHALAPAVVGSASPEAAAGGYTTADVVLLVTYVLLALVFSFLCSVAEAVLLSITPSYIAGLRESRPKRAALLQKLKQDNVDRSLAAILTLNTIAHTVGAIGSGAKATVVFGSAWFGLFSAVMTLLILFLSEIIPKTLGAVFWRHLAGVTAHFVRGLTLSLYPLIRVSEELTRWIARGKKVHVFNREEFVAMASLGEETGHLKRDESRILKNLFQLESLRAKDIMTPRTVMQALPQDLTVTQALDQGVSTAFSRFPLHGRSIDDVTGFVLKNDLLLAKAKAEGDVALASLRRDIETIAETMPLSDLLELFLGHRQHIALVVDEYGGTAGLVTLEDAVETLLGMEIVDEGDKAADMQTLARKQWAKRARALGLEIDPSLPVLSGRSSRKEGRDVG